MASVCFRWDGADAWQWWDGSTLQHGDTAAAATAAAGEPVRVVLAAPQVWVCAQILPRLPAARLARAAMFALEDQLASELDAVHVAVGKRRADGLTELAVIGRAQLDAALARLREAGMKVAGITPLAALAAAAVSPWHRAPSRSHSQASAPSQRKYGIAISPPPARGDGAHAARHPAPAAGCRAAGRAGRALLAPAP